MFNSFLSTAVLAAGFVSSTAVQAQTAPVKGTLCFANLHRDGEPGAVSCKGLGKFASIAELYERGYRVVSSGVLPTPGTTTAFLIVEERK